MSERILVTGANGCIGAWVVKALVAEGVGVVAFDKVVDEHRHRLVNAGGLPDVDWRIGDLTVLRDAVTRNSPGTPYMPGSPSTEGTAERSACV